MFNLQGSEIIVILLLALVVLGPEKLPDAVRKFTQTYNELKKMGNGFQSELRSVIDEPMREMRNTADMVRDAADPSKAVEVAQATNDDTSPTAPSGTDPRPSSTPPVAPPPPFASSRQLGRALPQPDGLPSLDLAPPAVNGHHRNGEAPASDRADDVDDLPAPGGPAMPPPAPR